MLRQNAAPKILMLVILSVLLFAAFRQDHPVVVPRARHVITKPELERNGKNYLPNDGRGGLTSTEQSKPQKTKVAPGSSRGITEENIVNPDALLHMEKQAPLQVELVGSKSFLNALLPVLSVFLAILSVLLTWDTNSRTLRQKAHDDEIKDIQQRLNTFYGPFRQLLKTSENLYRLFTHNKPQNFRTLTELIKGRVFTGNDAALLKEIIQVTQRLDQLITENSALIDAELQPLIAQASTHFRLMYLASKGYLKSEPERFENNVYPRNAENLENDLNYRVGKEINRLKAKQEELRQSAIRRLPLSSAVTTSRDQ